MQDQYTAPGFTRSLDITLPSHLLDILPSLTGIEVKVLLCVFSDQGMWFPTVTVAEIAARLQESADVVAAVLDRLIEQGWVRTVPDGFMIRWQAPDPDASIFLEGDPDAPSLEERSYPPNSREEFNHLRDRIETRVFVRDGFACCRCGSRHYLSVDHITPLSKGGTNQDSNYQTLCRRCNSRKGAR